MYGALFWVSGALFWVNGALFWVGEALFWVDWALFWVSGNRWENNLGGWGWVRMSGSGCTV